MCGITGFLHCGRTAPNYELETSVRAMADVLSHRGPDDIGVWVDPKGGLALGHRRLAILDLTPEGHQPMLSACGRMVVVFNGEIYNYKDIRKQLEDANTAPQWRGHSDTEVLLAAVSTWGVESAIQRFVGMFSIAVWDRSNQTLHLARDRLGEKPLYFGWLADAFVFASELRALKRHTRWRQEIDRDAVALFMRYGCIPAPESIYRGIYKLQPGHLLTLSRRDGMEHIGTAPKSRPYWCAFDVAYRGLMEPFKGTDVDAIRTLESLLRRSVREQMVADVPLGAFLSGGVDSSTVVALMQAESNRPVKTFTIGFNDESFNEARYAKAVAHHLGTDHTELYVDPEKALAVIPRLPDIYDEPFADSSQVPTFLVAQLARTKVKVALSGDGGDEVFGGYNRYFLTRRIWQAIGRIPRGVRTAACRLIQALPFTVLEQTMKSVGSILPRAVAQTASADKVLKLADILDSQSAQEIYGRLVSHWRNPTAVVHGVIGPSRDQWLSAPKTLGSDDIIAQMMIADLVTYLPDDILVKIDRASMAVSLESRIPLLDHRIVEFSWSLPTNFKIRKQMGKWLLRQILYAYVPKALIDRPKTGFGVPIGTWLRGPLRDWAEDLLDERRLKTEGVFMPEPIVKKWREHVRGKRNWQHYLWDVLMFQAWLRAQSLS